MKKIIFFKTNNLMSKALDFPTEFPSRMQIMHTREEQGIFYHLELRSYRHEFKNKDLKKSERSWWILSTLQQSVEERV